MPQGQLPKSPQSLILLIVWRKLHATVCKDLVSQAIAPHEADMMLLRVRALCQHGIENGV